MTGHGTFVTPPVEAASRLALVWASTWTRTGSFSLADTKPIDSCVSVCLSDATATKAMGLTAKQAREIAMELIIRADIIDPTGGV